MPPCEPHHHPQQAEHTTLNPVDVPTGPPPDSTTASPAGAGAAVSARPRSETADDNLSKAHFFPLFLVCCRSYNRRRRRNKQLRPRLGAASSRSSSSVRTLDVSEQVSPAMFRKKSLSRAVSKDLSSGQTVSSSAPAAPVETAAAAPAPAAAPVVPATANNAEVVPKKPSVPTGPVSIVPPGTKKVLVVGKYVVMTADVDNCDAVIVQGNLDGNIKAKYIVIVKGGCMRGKVECEEADIAGSFEGMEMTVHNRLTLSATARVGGKTTHHRLSVHDGAILTGELINKPRPSSRDAKLTPSAKTTAKTTKETPPVEKPVTASALAPPDGAQAGAEAEAVPTAAVRVVVDPAVEESSTQ